ncbi:FeS cluster assembly protein SufD [Gammaproteobacteria bacterium]|nr:Fe-S cluster assembly protein SufD [Gammaproteobacteria bacterium]CAG0941952.1 FeS cluster assembly protein SufD [Gammaproteobacteria bacterium]
MNARLGVASDLAGAFAIPVHTRPGLEWLQRLQLAALRQFERAGFPSSRLEDWRYTDLSGFAERSLRLSQPDPLGARRSATASAAQPVPAGMGVVAIFDAGMLLPAASRLEPLAGLSLLGLDSAPARPAWETSLAGDTREDGDALASLNAAMLADGLAVEVAAGVDVERPLYIVHGSGPARIAHDRIILRLKPGSSCTLIEHQTSSGASAANSVTDIICERDARLTYVRLQDGSDEAFHLATQRIHLHAGAEARLLGIDLGGQLARNDLRVTLEGPGAATDIHGLFFADGRRHIDNQTRVDHRAVRTRCREHFRGIADGSGRGIFNGKILVHPGADKADAVLRNENLLLSRQAEIDTKPELEIYADDVKCAHGATTGQLDPASIFYLRSRGIDAAAARRMLIAAFAREIVKQLPVKDLEDHIVELLGSRLPDLADVGAAP